MAAEAESMSLPMSASPILRVQTISKSYGGARALADVSLSVQPGEMVALIGPSGSGKSTLMRAIAGLVRIDEGPGVVELFGETIQERGALTQKAAALRPSVAFIFQAFNLIGRLTLFTNAALGALGRLPLWRGLLGFWPAETRRAAMAALSRMELADRAGQRANTLSGGQQQRAAIARALVQGARLILADEPVASLDPVSARRVMRNLERLSREDGLTTLVSLHQVDVAMRYCPRAVALRAGRIVYDGPARGLTRERLVEIYGPEIQDALVEEP